jgi:hypothetical protein
MKHRKNRIERMCFRALKLRPTIATLARQTAVHTRSSSSCSRPANQKERAAQQRATHSITCSTALLKKDSDLFRKKKKEKELLAVLPLLGDDALPHTRAV